MYYRQGVFIVVYCIDKEDNPIYLLLKRKLHWQGWEFPKGGIKQKEKIQDAVIREVKEETGLKPKAMKKFTISGRYKYAKEFPDRKGINGQTFESLYAVELKSKKISIDEQEHSSYKWLPYEKAIKILTWQNQKECLKKVHEYLIAKSYTGFRKTITSSGKLLLAGKTESNNEKLIKKIVKPNEIVFHTRAKGSPFVVIKSKQKPTKQDLKEAAIFCAKYSQDYKKNKSDVKLHYFKGKDIYKTPSMKTGTFGVKNFKEIKIQKEEIK